MPATLASGPRTRTGFASMGSALPAIKGVTVTVLPETSTTFDAPRLNASASCDAPFEATRNGSLGSRVSLI